MMNKNLTLMGLTLLMSAPLFAGSRPAVPIKVEYPALTPQEGLERDVRIAQARIENPGYGTKMLMVQQERVRARQDLVVAQARLEAFKTAGPKMDIPRLQQAI